MKAVKAQELFVCGQNKAGLLFEISKAVGEAGVNIRTISAYVVEDKAFFRLVTSDNTNARKALEPLGVDIEAKPVVIMELSDRVSALAEVSEKLKENNLDLRYIYGTVSKTGDVCTLVFSSSNDERAVEVLN
jgi:hypothetical protein